MSNPLSSGIQAIYSSKAVETGSRLVSEERAKQVGASGEQ